MLNAYKVIPVHTDFNLHLKIDRIFCNCFNNHFNNHFNICLMV